MNTNDKVWYACYGSNLNANRFKYYIEGGDCPFNGKYYKPCYDPTLWTESRVRRFNGELYFGSCSGTWGGHGVAFYDPEADKTVIMRLYLITWGQLEHVQKRECARPEWYGRLVPLGEENGIPIYTFTSEFRHDFNAPSEKYLAVIHEGLVKGCGLSEAEADAYLASATGY